MILVVGSTGLVGSGICQRLAELGMPFKANVRESTDTVLQPLHLEHPDWLPVYDIQADKAAASKQQVFDRAAAEHALVLGQHFSPFPSLGYVTKKQDGGWLWQPLA